MGRVKESLGLRSGGRGAFFDASPRRRCPVCGKDSWCQIARDGGTVLCKHESAGSVCTRTNRQGIAFHVHHIRGSAPRTFAPAPSLIATLASAERRDEVYRAFLLLLSLREAHYAGLIKRGLQAQHIARGMYRTLALEGRARITRALIERVGEPEGVPGFYVQREGERLWWTFAGAPGLVVPVRNIDGLVVALKIRREVESDGPKYTYFSSAHKGGPSAENALHVPVFVSVERSAVVRITEGELKSDVASVLSATATISVPGIGSWRSALPALEVLEPSCVLVAFDNDARTNLHVARAQLELVRAVRDAGWRVHLERWSHEHKGIDEFLLANTRAEVTQ